jgi:hypothetical protein
VSVVVERGLARCPRCVAVADYSFIESGPNSLRYEVHCGRCGEAYCEVHTAVAPDFSAAAGALAIRAPDVVAPRASPRQRAVARLDGARRWTSRETRRAVAWITLRASAIRR